MSDIEKVIKELEEANDRAQWDGGICKFTTQAVEFIIDMLKEKEAVKPVIAKYCGICGAHVKQKTGDDPGWKYCPNCGRAVKWDAAD